MIICLISIIIPTYNRANLIGETLDSILAQTYQNWECIVIDDGSTDHTHEVLAAYCKKDSRFQYYQRPSNKPKGANACRNYGFELSKGEFINWFDDDDIMLPNKILTQVNLLSKNFDIDYCVVRFINFDSNNNLIEENAFELNRENEFNLSNYILHKVFWGTIDFMIRRNKCELIRFDETLKSGQEYNFFIALYSSNNKLKGIYLDNILSHRRIHPNSIQNLQKQDKIKRLENKFNVYWYSYYNYNNNMNKEVNLFLLKNSCLFFQSLILLRIKKVNFNLLFNELKTNLSLFKALIIILIFIGNYYSEKGDVIGSRVIKSLFK